MKNKLKYACIGLASVLALWFLSRLPWLDTPPPPDIPASPSLANSLPLVIGITTDDTGRYSNDGKAEYRGIMMAIDERNRVGGVLDREIQSIHIDTATDKDVARRAAIELMDNRGAGFLIGAMHSGLASVISDEAQKRGVIYLNTNSSSPAESGKNCHSTKFVWDANGQNFSAAIVYNAMRWMGNRWFLLTADYDWGHSTAAATRKLVENAGGIIVDEILVPEGTRDYETYLEKIAAADVNVVAAVIGGDDMKALQSQVQERDQDRNPAWLNNQQNWPDVRMRDGKGLFGIFGTTWYHGLNLPGVSNFVDRYKTKYPDNSVPLPGNVFYNGYMATKSLLQAIEDSGTTQNHAVIRTLEGLRVSALDRLQHNDGYINPTNHHFQQTIYMATANPSPVDVNDLYKIISHINPEEIGESDDQSECVLESFSETPVFEP